jgi:hypothetical protein
MSTGAGGALGEGGAVGAAGAADEGEAAFAAAGAAEEPSPVVTLGEAGEGAVGADATVVAGVPVGLSDALPGPPPRATDGPGVPTADDPAAPGSPTPFVPPKPVASAKFPKVKAGVPVGLSDALPGPPPRATVVGVPGGAFGLEPPATASDPMPPGPIDNEGAAGEPLPKPCPPKFGAAFVLAEVAVELPDPFVVLVGPNRLLVSVPMLLRAACAAADPNSWCAKSAKLGPGAASGEVN